LGSRDRGRGAGGTSTANNAQGGGAPLVGEVPGSKSNIKSNQRV